MSEPTAEQPTAFKTITQLPREQRWEHYGKKFLVPLDHPNIPPAGPDFARTVHDLIGAKVAPKMPRDDLGTIGVDYLYRHALYRRKWELQVNFKGQLRQAEFLPGGLWTLPPVFDIKNSSVDTHDHEWAGYAPVGGPRKLAAVMVVGKHPGAEELFYKQNFIGPASADLHRALREIGVPPEVRHNWYVTNAVKHNRLDPTSGNMQQAWLKNCAPLLWQEILLVRPRFIVCLGTEAIKAVLGKGFTVTNMTGRVIEKMLRVPPAAAGTQADFENLDDYFEHKILIMGLPHPAYIFRVPEAYPDLVSGLTKFLELVGGDRPRDVEEDRKHAAYHAQFPLAKAIDNILEKAHHEWKFDIDGDLPVAWDAEWHGRQPADAGAYLRTIQFAVGEKYDEAPKKATSVVLTEKGGGTGWFHSREEVAGELRRLVEGRHRNDKMPLVRTRHGGHFFKADIPWIDMFLGINFRPLWTTLRPRREKSEEEPEGEPKVQRFDGVEFRKQLAAYKEEERKATDDDRAPQWSAPDPADRSFIRGHEPWELTRYMGGFDTCYMAHAVFEAAESFGLESLALRWTTCPRWSTDIEQAKIRIAKEMGIKLRDLIGYGDIPDHEILPYACYDADATLRLFWKFNFARAPREGEGFLDHDVHHQNSREAFWRTMLAGLAFLEMEETGVAVDVDRGKELIKVFELVKERLTTSLRDDLGWPAFNPNSAPQVRAWLFGEEYSGAIDKKTGKGRPLMPRKDMSLGKVPIKTTGKPPKAWEQVQYKDAKLYTPAVDKEVLGIYAWEDPRIKKLRDIRYVRQVLQSVLRPPKVGEAVVPDGDGGIVYDELDEFDGGFLSYVSPRDGRVRSRFAPVETRRCSSAGPNLQNLAKRREDDYGRILGHYDDEGKLKGDYLDILGGPLYRDPIRSIVTADLWDGVPTVLMEFDIVSAEIAALAWESGDPQMIADVTRAMLDEDDPKFLDIHGATAVEAFKLSCAPTKKGLKSIGKPGLRVAAKNVRFGVPYGRSAEALARQCREEGADVSVRDCQRLIINYHKRYPLASHFLDACEAIPAADKPFMVGAFGGMRRFQRVDDRSVLADQGRSAKNYPIQNLVADAILLGMYNLLQVRAEMGLENAFQIVLQIHDAIMLRVKVPYIATVRDEVIPVALKERVPIMPRTLKGTPFSEVKKEEPERGYLHLDKPYRFKVDCSVFLNWGQAIDPVHGRSLGIPEQYLGSK